MPPKRTYKRTDSKSNCPPTPSVAKPEVPTLHDKDMCQGKTPNIPAWVRGQEPPQRAT